MRSALTLLFDGVIVHGITRQLHALSYAETTGTITASKVTESSDSDGSTCGFEVRYTYEVNGQKNVGDRYRYSQWRASNSSTSVEPHTTKDSDGNSHTSWRPTVVINAPDGVQRSEVLVGWNDEVRATALVEWLKARGISS